MSVIINGSAGVTTNSGAVYNSIQGDTVKTATGTSVDFTSIPSWAKRITVMLAGVSTSSTSNLLLQIGDSGGIENTGYVSNTAGGGTPVNSTAGFILTGTWAAAYTFHGALTILFMGSNIWVCSGAIGYSIATTPSLVGGSKTLSDTLDRVRITTVNGTDTFDAGSINILYE
jgi:hypothetical protein